MDCAGSPREHPTLKWLYLIFYGNWSAAKICKLLKYQMSRFVEEKSLKIPIFEKIQQFFKIVQNLDCKYWGLQTVYWGENDPGMVPRTKISHFSGYLPLVMHISWFWSWATEWPNLSFKIEGGSCGPLNTFLEPKAFLNDLRSIAKEVPTQKFCKSHLNQEKSWWCFWATAQSKSQFPEDSPYRVKFCSPPIWPVSSVILWWPKIEFSHPTDQLVLLYLV